MYIYLISVDLCEVWKFSISVVTYHIVVATACTIVMVPYHIYFNSGN